MVERAYGSVGSVDPGVSLPAFWTPDNLTGVIGFWNFMDLTKLTDAGSGACSTVTSAQGRSLTQATNGNRPTMNVRTTPSGRHALDFDGTNDRLRCTAAGIDSSQPLWYLCGAANDDGADSTVQVLIDDLGGNPVSIGKNASNQWVAKSGVDKVNTATVNTSWHNHFAQFNGASGFYSIDGVHSSAGGSTNVVNGTSLGIGCDGNTANFWDGPVCAFTYGAGVLSAGDEALWNAWLLAQAGI